MNVFFYLCMRNLVLKSSVNSNIFIYALNSHGLNVKWLYLLPYSLSFSSFLHSPLAPCVICESKILTIDL